MQPSLPYPRADPCLLELLKLKGFQVAHYPFSGLEMTCSRPASRAQSLHLPLGKPEPACMTYRLRRRNE